MSQQALDGDTASGEENGVEGGGVIGLAVQHHHDGQQPAGRDAEPAPRRMIDAPRQAGDPDKREQGAGDDDLLEQECRRGKDQVFAVLAMFQKFQHGQTMVPLPKGIWQKNCAYDQDALPKSRRCEGAAVRDQESEQEREGDNQGAVFGFRGQAESGSGGEPPGGGACQGAGDEKDCQGP